jgi:hypothetical protein
VTIDVLIVAGIKASVSHLEVNLLVIEDHTPHASAHLPRGNGEKARGGNRTSTLTASRGKSTARATERSHIVTVTRHTGPISSHCPIDCLWIVIPCTAFNALARAYSAPFAPPSTVGEVIALYELNRLVEIRGLGHRLIAQIEAGLIEAGLISQPERHSGGSN